MGKKKGKYGYYISCPNTFAHPYESFTNKQQAMTLLE